MELVFEYKPIQEEVNLKSQIAVFVPTFNIGDIVEYRDSGEIGRIDEIKVISSREFDDPDFKHWAMMVYEIGDDWVTENEIVSLVKKCV